MSTRGYLDDAVALGDATGARWAGLPLDALAFQIARLDRAGRLLVVLDEEDRAESVFRALRFFHPSPDRVCSFPADDGRPYDGFSPERTRVQQRTRTLARIATGEPLVVVASVGSLIREVPTTAVRERGTSRLIVGREIERSELVGGLTDAGYLSAPTAEFAGSFAVRGDVIDIWPAGSHHAVRVDFFDDEIEGIRRLDPTSGRPAGTLPGVTLLPAREARLDGDALARATEQLGRLAVTAEDLPRRRRVVEEVRAGIRFSGIEDWLPALVETESPLQAMADLQTVVYELGDVESAARELYRSAQQRWSELDEDERPLVPPSERYTAPDEIAARLAGATQVWAVAADDTVLYSVQGVEQFAIHGTELAPTAAKLHTLLDSEQRVGIVVDRPERVAALEGLLEPHGLRITRADDPLALDRGKLSVLVGDLPRGFSAAESGWVFLPAAVLFGGQSHAKREKMERIHALFDREVTDLSQLKVDDHIVHSLHGVGIYRGLKRVPVMGVQQDFVSLEYRGGDTMFLPVTKLGLISRYTPANSSAEVRLDRLGGQTWTKRKGKVRDNLLKMATELLALYAKRELATRQPVAPRGPVYATFEARFPHEETPDQRTAIDSIHDDFDRPFPMDRLLCGDVGFGKTEVALRAAMRMVESGKQVVVLCPTTVLAYQHFNTWTERFLDLPVKIGMLSRFTSRADEKATVAELKTGEVDIVIGTTKLLGRGIGYADLGLVVIDEEHRFGVRQKDRLRKLRTAVDVLAMSATPIPRTLQQALGGIRDMSVMTTPPGGRLAVATSTARLSERRVRDAILTEMERGGQVFVIHNRVETIGRFTEQLRDWVPEANFAIAHGQMSDDGLESVLVEFIEERVDVLVCTAIVETGIDLPNVNTMLIHRADTFGLAQLYQLRGRIGRSTSRGRCLLLVPEQMTRDARKRIRILVENTELGAGFRIASADLELRGGGNLIGAAQSGQIDKVGYDVWVELLDEAISIAKGEAALERIEPEVEIGVDSFIPERMIPDMRERLGWYSKLTHADDVNEVEALLDEIESLYGDLEEPVRNLAGLVQTNLRCEDLGIARVRWLKIRTSLELHPASPLSQADIAAFQARHPKRVSVLGAEPTRFDVRFTPSESERPFQFLMWVFAQLDRARRGEL